MGRRKKIKRINIDFDALKPMDLVLVTNNNFVGRVTRRVTAGRDFKNNEDIATHVAIVVSIHGQKMLIEMSGYSNGIICRPISDYEYKYHNNGWIIDILRHDVFSSNPQHRKTAQMELIQRWRRNQEGRRSKYGYTDLLSFVFPFIKDSKRSICSELYVEATRDWVYYPQPHTKNGIYSPYELQKFTFNSPSWEVVDWSFDGIS